ncbi:MAG: sugar phosphate nucleotidyltransferase [[Eubacterium] siraeum]
MRVRQTLFTRISALSTDTTPNVAVLSGDHIYKMNYNKMLNSTRHIMRPAIAFLKCRGKSTPFWHNDYRRTMTTNLLKPAQPKSNLASMGLYSLGRI